MVKRRIGFEELIRYFRDKPKYLCQRCLFKFRAQKYGRMGNPAKTRQAISH